MAGYGYAYRSVSTYSTVREESRGPVVKPFIPFVPGTNSNSEGYVTKKTIVPIASKTYGDDYPTRGDDYDSPRNFLSKVSEASRPKRFTPVSSTVWHQPPQPPTTYNDGANGYGDYGSNKEGRKPVGVAIKNDNYDGHNGYGDYGSNKEGRKPIGSAIRNDSYDGYNGPNGYGDYGNKEGRKLVGNPIKSDNYGSHDNPHGYGDTPNGYGDYGNKEGRKLVGSPIKSDNYGSHNNPNGYGDDPIGYGDYGNKEGRKLVGSPIKSDNYHNNPHGYGDGHNSPHGYGDYYNYGNEGHKPVGGTIKNDKYDGYNSPTDYGGYADYNSNDGYKSKGSPVRNGNYDGAKSGYGGYGNKEGHRPYGSSTTRDDNHDGYRGGNGYDDYGDYVNREGYKPSGSPVRNDNYDRHRPAGNFGAKEPIKIIPSKPKLSSAWTASPRKGTQLSEPTNDIDKAVQMLKEAAKLSGHGDKGGFNDNDYQRKHDKPTSKFGKGMELVKEVEELKNIVSGTPHSGYSVKSVKPPPITKDYGDDTRRYGNASIIDSRKAEKLYNGKRV